MTEYLEQTNTNNRVSFKQDLNKSQYKLLSLSLLYAGIGFLIVAGLSILFAWIIRENLYSYIYTNTYLYVSIGISVGGVIIACILQLFWFKNIINASYGIIFLNYLIYMIIYTAILAPLIAMINDYWTVLLAVAILGLVVFLCGIIGCCFMNAKAAICISKIIWICMAVLFTVQFIFLLSFCLSYTFIQTWEIIYLTIFALISIGAIVLMFYNISVANQFVQLMDNVNVNKLAFYFGFNLMCLFLQLFAIILRFIFRIKE